MAKLSKQEEYEIRWVDAYFNHNFNGRLTSKSLKPHLSLESCEVDAARMLGKDRIKELIEIKREEIRIKQNVTLEWLIEEFKKTIYDVNTETVERDQNGRITSKPEYKSKHEALKEIAKLTGHYQPQKIDVTTNGESLNLKDLISFDDEDNSK